MTDRKGSRYDKTFCHIAQSTEKAMATFCSKIIEIAQMVYQHERMLIPMEKLKGEKKRNFDNATRCYICGDPFHGIAKQKVADHDHSTGKY